MRTFAQKSPKTVPGKSYSPLRANAFMSATSGIKSSYEQILNNDTAFEPGAGAEFEMRDIKLFGERGERVQPDSDVPESVK